MHTSRRANTWRFEKHSVQAILPQVRLVPGARSVSEVLSLPASCATLRTLTVAPHTVSHQ